MSSKKMNGKMLAKTPTKAEILAEKYANVIIKMEKLAQMIDTHAEQQQHKFNLQGSTLVAVIEHIAPSLPTLDVVPENAINLIGDVWLEKNKMYVIKQSGDTTTTEEATV